MQITIVPYVHVPSTVPSDTISDSDPDFDTVIDFLEIMAQTPATGTQLLPKTQKEPASDGALTEQKAPELHFAGTAKILPGPETAIASSYLTPVDMPTTDPAANVAHKGADDIAPLAETSGQDLSRAPLDLSRNTQPAEPTHPSHYLRPLTHADNKPTATVPLVPFTTTFPVSPKLPFESSQQRPDPSSASMTAVAPITHPPDAPHKLVAAESASDHGQTPESPEPALTGEVSKQEELGTPPQPNALIDRALAPQVLPLPKVETPTPQEKPVVGNEPVWPDSSSLTQTNVFSDHRNALTPAHAQPALASAWPIAVPDRSDFPADETGVASTADPDKPEPPSVTTAAQLHLSVSETSRNSVTTGISAPAIAPASRGAATTSLWSPRIRDVSAPVQTVIESDAQETIRVQKNDHQTDPRVSAQHKVTPDLTPHTQYPTAGLASPMKAIDLPKSASILTTTPTETPRARTGLAAVDSPPPPTNDGVGPETVLPPVPPRSLRTIVAAHPFAEPALPILPFTSDVPIHMHGSGATPPLHNAPPFKAPEILSPAQYSQTVRPSPVTELMPDNPVPAPFYREPVAATLALPPDSIATTTGNPPTTPSTQVTQFIIQIVHKGGDGPIELTLTPEELGQVRIEIATTGDKLHVTLFAEHPDAMDLIRRNGDQLLNDLRLSGFSHPSLSFGDWSQRDTRTGKAPGQTKVADSALSKGDTQLVITSTQNTAAVGRLDLRL